jgi:hypothetical protein
LVGLNVPNCVSNVTGFIKFMKNTIYTLFFGSTWIFGIVLAKGFISTLIAVIFPLWAWYLVAEKCLQMLGWI